MPKFSLLMPVYNKAGFLATTINSLLDQTYKDFELIIWDDGSTDSSHQVIMHFADKDKRIRYFKSTENKGVSYSRNRLTELATGDIVCIIDADDIYNRLKLQQTKDYFDKHPEVDIVYHGLMEINAWDNKLAENGRRQAKPFDKERLQQKEGQYISHGAMALKRQVAKDNPYDEKLKYGVDFPFIRLLASKDYKWGWIKSYLQTYRRSFESVSWKHRQTIEDQGNA